MTSEGWQTALATIAEAKRLAVLRIGTDDWRRLAETRKGTSSFTIARSHDQFEDMRGGMPCLIIVDGEESGLFIGVVKSRDRVATLDSRIKVVRIGGLQSRSLDAVLPNVMDGRVRDLLKAQLANTTRSQALSPKAGAALMNALAGFEGNQRPMRAVAAYLAESRRFRGAVEIESDAVRTALAVFGLGADEPATVLEVSSQRETALDQIPFIEDSAIEHDARFIPGLTLTESDVTGRAVFERGGEKLEVLTANRRGLEHVFGVDLIYFNLIHRNAVMVQYKMLERSGGGPQTDWTFRPNEQFENEIARMKLFAPSSGPGSHEYRLNPAALYIKFVKRNALLRNGSILVPLDHFDIIRKSPRCQGPKKGLVVSFEKLEGQYMRHTAFVDLLRSGYIGAHTTDTTNLKTLVDATLNGNRAVVAAVQSRLAASLGDAELRLMAPHRSTST
jgi:hypothetical protein